MITLKYLQVKEHSLPCCLKSLLIPTMAAMLLSACTEGGGAGDFEDDPQAVALVTPLVGIYDLPDNWTGFPPTEAYLEIQEPDNSGLATALIHRVSSFENCIESRPAQGEVRKDPFSDRVFLDRFFELENAVLTRTGPDLTISLPKDVMDVDDDGDFDESVVLLADQLGVMSVSDLGEICQ